MTESERYGGSKSEGGGYGQEPERGTSQESGGGQGQEPGTGGDQESRV